MSRSASPLHWLRQRWQRWWQGRLAPTDTVTLTQRNVYILPTGAGWMLALTLLVLLVGAINYQLNLGYLLTFLLAGSAAVGVYLCHATLRGATLHLRPPAPQFMGHATVLEVEVTNPSARPRYGIALAVRTPDSAPHWAWTDVPAQGSATVHMAFTPSQRGLHAAPLLTAETRYPLGTFRVWTYWRPAAQVLVYPAPETPAPPLPPGEPRPGGSGSAPVHGGDEFDGVRAYQRGDAMKLVVWKKAAQALATGSNALVSRDAQRHQHYELWLDVQRTGLADPEARIARVTAWVLAADRLGVAYGVRLPHGVEIAPDSGQGQRRRCLEALALC